MSPPPPPSPEILLEHGAFLRRLARSLVVDEQRAEDVVQETYLAVLQRPPPPGVRLKAWLGGIARNLSRRARRTEGRVARREHRAAKPEGRESDPIAERLEIQRLVSAAVARLPEPGRTALVHRYYDGLTPTMIAAEEGVSVRTIESRLRRARERLRADLDARYGDRAAWQAALLPVAGWTGATGLESTATSGAQASVPTAAGVGTAVAAGVTIVSIKTTVLLVAACTLGAFFIGRELAPAPALAPTEDVARDDPGAGPMLNADAAVLANTRKDLADTQQALHDARAENQQLAARVAALEAGGPGATEAKPGTPTGASTVWGPEQHRAVLEAQDWAQAGEAVTKLLPLLNELTDAIVHKKDYDDSKLLEIPKYNGPLQRLAIDLVQKGIPGTGVNGSFSHPAASVNLIRAALAQAEVPLTEGQDARLAELGDRFLLEDARRQEAYGDDTLAMQMAIEEADLKDRFYADVDGLLTAEQVNVLHPPAIKGRLGVDIFSSGIIWHTLAKSVRFQTREDLATRLPTMLAGEWGVAEVDMDTVKDAARTWANSFSDEDLAALGEKVYTKSASLSNGLVAGWTKVEIARRAAGAWLQLQRTLLDRLPPTSDAAKQIRSAAPQFPLPIKK